MKKTIAILLMVMLISSLAIRSSHAVIGQSPDHRIKTAVWVGIDGVTPSSGSALTTDNRVLGFKVTNDGAAAEGAIYDAAQVGAATNTTIIDESNTIQDGTETTWFPSPRSLSNGLVAVTQASTTRLVVYYE